MNGKICKLQVGLCLLDCVLPVGRKDKFGDIMVIANKKNALSTSERILTTCPCVLFD